MDIPDYDIVAYDEDETEDLLRFLEQEETDEKQKKADN